MPRNIIMSSKHVQKTSYPKVRKKSFTRKNFKSKKLQKQPKIAIFLALQGQFLPFFHDFQQMTSKYAKKHHTKNSEKSIHWKNFKVQITAKMAKNYCFLVLEGRIVTLFSHFLKITSKYGQKHHIKKSEKFLSLNNCENGKKMDVFWPWRAEFRPFFHNLFSNHF